MKIKVSFPCAINQVSDCAVEIQGITLTDELVRGEGIHKIAPGLTLGEAEKLTEDAENWIIEQSLIRQIRIVR